MSSGLKVGDLYGEIGLEREPFNRGLSKAHADFMGFGQGLLGSAAKLGAGLGAGLGAAELVHKIGDIGITFQDLGNTFKAVTSASSAQMQEMGRRATELGNDLTLPATSASDAERAMLELAKGGLQVQDAMDAAKGTLQLAAAAEVDAGQAAIFQADALNAFHLKGKDAVMVADLLAGAANASSGEITDMALSLQQAGSVFAAANVPIQTVVTLISEMAQNGIRGSDAGTSLKTMLMALQSPTSQQAELMRQLNFNLYDSRGRMRDWRDVIKDVQGPLSKLTQQQRDQALATIFGSDAVRAANIIFGSGTDAFDKMAAAVTKQGAAADVAAAKSQGLGGALRGIQSQLETLAQQIFEKAAPSLEALARGASEKLPDALDGVKGGIGELRKVLDPFIKESVWALRDAFKDSEKSAGSLGKDLGDVHHELEEFTKSEAFASIVAGLAVYLPEAAGVTFRALALMADQTRMTVGILGGLGRVTWDLSQGDFKAAWRDAGQTVSDYSGDVKTTITDLEEFMKATQHATSDDVAREWAAMRFRIQDQMNGSAADQRLAWESIRTDARQMAKETGQVVPSELMQGIHEGKAAVASEARQTVKEAVDGAHEEATAARDVGGFLAAGIAYGIVQHAGQIDAAARSAIRTAMIQAQKENDIKSPSRLWADQLGRPLAQGIGVGFRDELSRVMGGLLTPAIVVGGTLGMPAMASAAASGRGAVTINQNFYGATADHRQMLADAAWDARRLR